MQPSFQAAEADVLVVVDVQNDFCPGGALAVERGDEVVPLINRLAPQFRHVVFTQDWHPLRHASFASTHGKKPFETLPLYYGEQVLWPDHCVQGTPGAEFHPALDRRPAELVVRKGFRANVDSYSAFYENDHVTRTGLAGYLRDRGFGHVYICGLALDFCVKWSALDAVQEGFLATVVEDACRAIDLNGSLTQARAEMKGAGVQFTQTAKLAA
jgi:nicotinamidase/pyrazinamidase